VLAAQEHVKQVWINLISNAIKYNRPQGQVVVRLWRENGQVRSCVQDSGIGISAAEQEHLFEDFYRTEEAKRHSRQGTGLGLSIVKAILERYGGRIWVESTPGQGSTFCFTLPVLPSPH
jgi:signal transduction histidine kinase